ncbi:hypothetical protein ACQ4PT_039789 [Festuca glaucescens]
MWAGEAQYEYMSIADALKAAGARVCLFAAVSEIGAAFRSRGTGLKDLELQLRSVKSDSTFDLVCKVTHKFKTLVCVVSAYPCQGSDLHSLLTGNHCLRLTLEDPTARIHAYVHKDDGVRFFGGFLMAAALTRKMNRLLGVPEPEEADEDAPLARNPPWIWCCLKSYRLDKYDPWGSRRYRVFGTEIRD